jgi:hypothetical protein
MRPGRHSVKETVSPHKPLRAVAGNWPGRRYPHLVDEVEYIPVVVTSFERDEGTLVLFNALTDYEEQVTICVHPPYVSDIMSGLMRGEQPKIEVPWYIIEWVA